MTWHEFWWTMRNDAQARNDFLRKIGFPLAALAALYTVLICGIIYS